MKRVTNLVLSGALLVGPFHTGVALEVDREVLPRTTVGGRVIATLDAVDNDSTGENETEINTEDSAVLVRFDKRMYETGVAGAIMGVKENEGEVAFHQLQAFYWNRDFNSSIGRMVLRNSLLEFPIIRDEDLLTYTHVGNGSSNIEFDQRYGDQLTFDWIFDRKIQKLGVWAATQRDEPGIPAPGGLNTYGLGYVYELPEDLWYVKRVRHAGVLVDRQKVTTSTGDEWMNAVVGGAEFNLNMNPTSNWSMALQTIANEGVDGITASDIASGNPNAVANRARASSTALVVGLRYTGRPHLLTRYQGALTLAYKDYRDIPDATQWSVVPNFIYRIGQGVDLLAQVKYTDFSSGLGGGSDTTAQIGIAFSLEATFNDNIGERDSILNLEHGYIK